MKEILFSPQLIENEKKRLEEKNADSTDAEIYELLIKVYGGVNVAKYLTWNVEKLINERQE